MLVGVERQFGQRISLSVLFQEPTVRGLARLLAQDSSRQYDFRQVIKLQPNGTRAPLIAINNTGIYGLLAQRLGSDRPFTSLQLFDPALPNQELPQSLEEIAEGYVQLIRRVQPRGPYALLGWCVAGTLAFEIAQRLTAAGERVSQLFMIDTHVPCYFERMPRLLRLLARYSQRLKLIAQDWQRVRHGGHGLRSFLGRRLIVQKALRHLRRRPAERSGSDAMPGLVGDERYDQWLLHYLQDAAERYDPQPYPGRLVLFRSSEEPKGRFLDWRMGWGALVGRGVDVVEVDGDHFSMFRDPGVGGMAQYIAAKLDAGTR
jgi:thioesterase domain-containing protein